MSFGMTSRSEWTEDRVERLKQMHAMGHSCSIIAAELGGITRNAVIGKIHRLGLPRHSSHHPLGGLRRKTGRKPKIVREAKPTPRTRIPLEMLAEPLPAEDTPKGPLVMFADLEPHHCRASYGDPKQPGHGFCGCRVVPGTSWCEDHYRRFFVPPRVALPAIYDDQPTKPARASMRAVKRELAL